MTDKPDPGHHEVLAVGSSHSSDPGVSGDLARALASTRNREISDGLHSELSRSSSDDSCVSAVATSTIAVGPREMIVKLSDRDTALPCPSRAVTLTGFTTSLRRLVGEAGAGGRGLGRVYWGGSSGRARNFRGVAAAAAAAEVRKGRLGAPAGM